MKLFGFVIHRDQKYRAPELQPVMTRMYENGKIAGLTIGYDRGLREGAAAAEAAKARTRSKRKKK